MGLSKALFAATVLFAATAPLFGDPSTAPTGPGLPFGTDSFNIPEAPIQLNVPPGTIALLSEAIANTAGPDRLKYLCELGQCGDQALGDAVKYLHSNDAAERAEAVRAVAAIGQVSSSTQLITLLSDPDVDVRWETVSALKKLGNTAAITPALQDPSPLVQRAAMNSGGTVEQAEIIAGLLPTLSPALLPAALEAIGRCGTDSQAGAIVGFCNHQNPAVRAAAVRSLGRLKATRQLDAVTALLKDTFPTVRREAVTALHGVASPEAQQTSALAALTDPDPTVRQAAAELLRQVPTANAIDPLLSQLATDYKPLHDSAREALAAIGASVIPAAVKLTDSAVSRQEIDGVYLLAKVGSSDDLDRRVSLLDSQDWSVVAAAAQSLINTPITATVAGPHLTQIERRVPSYDGGPTILERNHAEAQSFLMAGKLRYSPIVDAAVRKVPVGFGVYNAAPDEVRVAAIWAIGVIISPDNEAAQLVRQVRSNDAASEAAVIESLKAIFNMGDPNALQLFSGWNANGSLNRTEACRWIAHYCYDRLSGTVTPFAPLKSVKNAEASAKPLQ